MGGEDFCRKLKGAGKIPLFFPKDPVNCFVSPQPGELTLGVLAGAEFDFFGGFGKAFFAAQSAEQFFVADGLQGGGRGRNASGQ